MNDKQLLFIERVRRYLRLQELEAPGQVIEQEVKLIKRSLAELDIGELAHAVKNFSATSAKMTKIQEEVDRKYPS